MNYIDKLKEIIENQGTPRYKGSNSELSKIPEGTYFVKVSDIKFIHTKNNTTCIYVLFKILDGMYRGQSFDYIRPLPKEDQLNDPKEQMKLKYTSKFLNAMDITIDNLTPAISNQYQLKVSYNGQYLNVSEINQIFD